MPHYANTTGKSNVVSYEQTEDGIIVEFGDRSRYEYTVASAGAAAIETMLRLAAHGSGLNGWIMRNVRKKYARKL